MVHRTPFILPMLYPSLTWRIPSNGKQLFLTFDDGPVPGPTEFVLETLRKFDIKATFFCIGDNIKKHPGIFKDIITAGHNNKTGRMISIYQGQAVHASALKTMFRHIIANNRAGGWRKLKAQLEA